MGRRVRLRAPAGAHRRQQRYEQLRRLDNAMESVREQYADTMAQASGTGPAGSSARAA
jgi:hypothetical protein